MKAYLQNELAAIKAAGLYRALREVEGPQGPRVKLNGREVINLCSNNYLGLADHPRVKEAATKATSRFGAGSGSSRLICGNLRLYRELEEELARFKGEEAALVFSSGFMANLGAISALMGREDVIFSDALNHASLIDGCRLSRARVATYTHADAAALNSMLASETNGRHRLIVTDSLFSMDGDLAPLSELGRIATAHRAWLMVDEAHATGVYGKNGQGLVHHLGLTGQVEVVMGTLGKALGSCGAYICGSQELIDFLINRARTLIFSTGLPPSALAAASASLRILSEDDSLPRRLAQNVQYFQRELAGLGFNTLGSKSQIIPLLVGENGPTMRFCERLLEEGVFIQGIRPPTVPSGAARLRLSLMAVHTREDLDRALTALEKVGQELGIIGG